MPSFELNKLQGVSPLNPLSRNERAAEDARPASELANRAEQSSPPGVSVEFGRSTEAIKPPVDSERVAQIREALRDGSYPILPIKIADAMIAAQISLGLPQADQA